MRLDGRPVVRNSGGTTRCNHWLREQLRLWRDRGSVWLARRIFKLRIPTFGKVGRVRALRSGASAWTSALRVGALGEHSGAEKQRVAKN